MENTITVKSVYKEAYAIVKAKFWPVVGQFFLVSVIFGLLDYKSKDNLFVSIVFSVVYAFVVTTLSLAYAEHGTFSWKEAADRITLKRLGYFSAGYLLAKVVTFAGLLLLIVPGVIAGIWLFPMRYVVYQHDIKPIPALKKSLALSKGKRMKIFELMCAAILVNILGALCLIVGLFFTIPLTYIAFAVLYKRLTLTVEIVDEAVAKVAEDKTEVLEAEVVPA